MAQKPPRLGDTVFYMTTANDKRAPLETCTALITRVNSDGSVTLHVFYHCGEHDLLGVQAAEDLTPGRWTHRDK